MEGNFDACMNFSIADINAAVAAGRVRVQSHPEFPSLKIANYTEQTQYKRDWDIVTLSCRGLIYDESTGDLVARPWRKFFNYGEADADVIDPHALVEVTDKMDGSLGILYTRPDGKLAMATRGSFTSEQAVEANKILEESYRNLPDVRGATYLFEIILPWNRIVVDYGQRRDIVLLGGVDNETGYYFGPVVAEKYLGRSMQVTRTFFAYDFAEALSLPTRDGKEGYIIRSGQSVVKVKQEDYIALHKIVTNLTPNTVWERFCKFQEAPMSRTQDILEFICEGIPDEFYPMVEEIATPMITAYYSIRAAALSDYINIQSKAPATRKEFAMLAKYTDYPSLCFLLADGKVGQMDSVIKRMVKPSGHKS